MGFLNEIKKALFGAKSVAKSAGRKAVERSKETSEEWLEKSDEWMDKARDKAADVSRQAKDKADDLVDDARDLAADTWKKAEDSADQARDRFSQEEEEVKDTFSDDPMDDLLRDREAEEPAATTPEEDDYVPFEPKAEGPTPKERKPSELEKLGGKVLDASGKTVDKAFDKAEEVGDDLLDIGEKFMGKVKETSEKLSKKAMEDTEESRGRVKDEAGRLFDKAKSVGEDLFNKAQEEAGKAGQGLDELTKEAERQEAELDRRVKERSARSNAENLERDRVEDPLSGTDSFFERAKRFAEGDYHNEGDKKEGDMEISKDPEYKPKPKEGTVAGFEDLDGDGDEIIDDAILDEEEEDNKKE